MLIGHDVNVIIVIASHGIKVIKIDYLLAKKLITFKCHPERSAATEGPPGCLV